EGEAARWAGGIGPCRRRPPRVKRLLVLVPLAAGLTVAASAQGASAFRITYYGAVHGPWRVFTVGSAGGTPKQLTSGPLNSADPALSRSATRIAYDKGSDSANTSDIWTMNADGSN